MCVGDVILHAGQDRLGGDQLGEAGAAADANGGAVPVGKYAKEGARTLLAHEFDRAALSSKGLKYERLDQLTMDILLGVR